MRALLLLLALVLSLSFVGCADDDAPESMDELTAGYATCTSTCEQMAALCGPVPAECPASCLELPAAQRACLSEATSCDEIVRCTEDSHVASVTRALRNAMPTGG